MKKIKYIALSVCAALSLTSCNDFLDKLPDDRAEIDSNTKITNLLVSAYPAVSNIMLNEMSTDNVSDNGKQYTTNLLKEEIYRFQNITDEGNDSPRHIWNGYYNAIATANQAIQAIEEMGSPASLNAQMAEAKLCRAYSMFQLATTFCMAWNPEKADEYLGLPYPKRPGSGVNDGYVRGTLRELYENINTDIEEALPYVSDDIYSVPKYHFNLKAAYAFAARFNLYYMNYDKCIQYANIVLGSVPTSVMRNFEPYTVFGRVDIGNRYVMTSEAANLLLVPAYSLSGRAIAGGSYNRFDHNQSMASYETFWVSMPWGSGSSNNTLYYSTMLYGTNQCVAFPKIEEFFEYTDKVNGSGYVHIVDPVFTGDETLLCRAEAYALKGGEDNLKKAVDDMNVWVGTHCKATEGPTKRPTLTVDNITSFINGLDYAPALPDGNRDRSMRKTLHPQGFTVAEERQENVIEFLLHMRRLETIFQGTRFMDIKRYGIEHSHLIAGEDAITFTAGDLRGAIQLPSDVINAGLEANPR
ncbi:RagB/SusD family nutrient uptake outer membrane protein [Xylanibacter caecicola]|uniref:RagB/SusD family nutrient uptake outer membrane protein n=1 Tax=Xylanibacter caecicola TaxID=2736294 RepID=UPI0025844479|nr:RagB/SusD family nutrient uptake outer membrane protein [Xylanibacter caecicola]